MPTGEPSEPGPPPDLRASDADRDRVIDVLRIAVGEGRLTPDEFEEQTQAVLSTRTFSELAPFTADLPPGPGRYVPTLSPPAAAALSDGDILIAQRGGSISHTGHWKVPRRIELRPSWCDVTLDFTDAVLTHDTLLIDMKMHGGTLTLVAGPGVVVDAEGLTVRYTEVEMRPSAEPGAKVVLRVELAGRMRYGRIEVRRPGRAAGW
ncbi:MAG: DUF1707 SHOCT-like domain-containing protein [Streptosporangiaceae bacterium]